jgi:hypothetical protein
LANVEDFHRLGLELRAVLDNAMSPLCERKALAKNNAETFCSSGVMEIQL